MASNDPDFETKAADVIGCISTRQPMPRCSASTRRPRFKLPRPTRSGAAASPPGRIERHGFEYYRHGRSLYAFNTKTGEALGKTAARHTSAESSWPSSVTSLVLPPALAQRGFT
ncbi:MAG: hypothetical protein U1F45_04545 [Burkholderiales bacterium]